MSIFNTLLKPISKIEMEKQISETKNAYLETTSAETPEIKITSKTEETLSHVSEDVTIANYFKNKDVVLDVTHSNNSFVPVEDLALLLASNYAKCKDFYRYIRGMIAKKKMDFCYNTYPLSDEDRLATNMIAEKLGKYGVISNLRIPHNSKEITGTISSAPRVINFINGDFLEFYARIVVKQVVEKLSKQMDFTYEIVSNAYITKGSEKHELDIVFRVGNEIFWAEIKSGKFSDFDCYRKLGVFMGVNPDKHILLSAEKTDEETETISWFYQFYVSNIQQFKTKLTEMITKAFGEDK